MSATLAAPEITLGSLHVCGPSPLVFDEHDRKIFDLLTAMVSRAIGDYLRYCHVKDAAKRTRRALDTTAPIEQATGMLMVIHGIDERQAADLLKKASRGHGGNLHAAAASLIEQASTGHAASGNR